MNSEIMDIKDLVVAPFFFLLIFFIAFIYRTHYEKGSPFRKYFVPALLVKIFGSFGFCMIYLFYYNGGDTIEYYEATKVLWEIFLNDIHLLADTYLASSYAIPEEFYNYDKWGVSYILAEPQSFFLVKLAFILSIPTFNSYLSLSLIFASFSFTGAFALYRTFVDAYPKLNKEFALSFLFVPTVIFWGSGLLKDTVTLASVGWLVFSFYYLFKKGERIGFCIIMLLISSFLLIKIKAYIFMSILPALMFWLVGIFKHRIRIKFVRMILGPMIIIIAIVFNYTFFVEYGKIFGRFSLENILNTAKGFQSWHTNLSELMQGSGYKLHEYESTFIGALKSFPAAVNVTLFRPYLWEIKNVLMFFSSVESTLILILTIYILIKTGILRSLRIIYDNPEVFFCMFFSIFFAYAVGFSSYNFGALVRYKIPCIPFYLSGLFIVLHLGTKEIKRKKIYM